jgi:hypothetical protein
VVSRSSSLTWSLHCSSVQPAPFLPGPTQRVVPPCLSSRQMGQQLRSSHEKPRPAASSSLMHSSQVLLRHLSLAFASQ